MWTDSELKDLARRIYKTDLPSGADAIELELDQFRKLYQFITDHWEGGYPEVTFVKTFGKEIIAQFPTIAPYRLIIIDKATLTRKKFEFVPDYKQTWHNVAEQKTNFLKFLQQEFIGNIWKLLPIFVISGLLLFVANNDNLYDLLSSLLIQGSTVFLSIFLIFTVTQNHLLAKDKELFDAGITYKYQQDDRNIAILAVLTIALTFLNTIAISIFNEYSKILAIQIYSVSLDVRLWKALSTAIVIVFLFDGFISVTDYYLYRNMDVIERDLIRKTLEENWNKHSSDRAEIKEKR